MHRWICAAVGIAGVAGITIGAGAAIAGEHDDAMQRSREVVEAAIKQARRQAGEAAAGAVASRNGLAPGELRAMQGADPARIATKYRNANELRSPEDTPAQELKIFVSTGMPAKALKMLGTQARDAGAVLVFRGLRKPLGTPGALQDMTEVLKDVAETGANIEIDPEAFARYDVRVVPTFVIAERTEGCSPDQCAMRAHTLVGDVTLEYALETWADKGAEPAQLARAYLDRMQGVAAR